MCLRLEQKEKKRARNVTLLLRRKVPERLNATDFCTNQNLSKSVLISQAGKDQQRRLNHELH